MSDDFQSALQNATAVSLWPTYHPPMPEEDSSVGPWRGISTECLPQELRKQLKPHWCDWILADPEHARYRRI